MQNFIFHSPTMFVFGRDTQRQTADLVKQFGGHRVLIASGHGSAERSGLLPAIRTRLQQAGIEYVELKGIDPNPTDDRVYEGIELARRHDIDFLLAVGGGSVIDTVKGIALGLHYDGDFWDFYCGKAAPKSAAPLGVVLTIPAAGSEGSGNSVITKLDGLHKISVRYPLILRPKFSIMNPELTVSLPWFQTACGVVDMIAHIQERYFSNTEETGLTDGIAESIMRTVMQTATRLKEQPDNYDLRATIMWAGMLAHNGLCGVGKVEDWASHRLEHEVSAIYNVAHGAGLAVIIPAWMQHVAKSNPHKVILFAKNVMGVEPTGKSDEEVISEGIEKLRAFYHTLELTTDLQELIGGKQPDVAALVKSLQANMGDTLGSYVELTMDECAEIYRLTFKK